MLHMYMHVATYKYLNGELGLKGSTSALKSNETRKILAQVNTKDSRKQGTRFWYE